MISYHHRIAAEGKFVVVMSAVNEGKEVKEDDQKAVEATCRRELKEALSLLEKVDELFFWVSTSYEAVNDSKKDNCFISNTYDATTHFESTTTEVLELYERITGKKIDLTVSTDPDTLKDPDSLDPTGGDGGDGGDHGDGGGDGGGSGGETTTGETTQAKTEG